ncbi:MAG: glycosyltransferase family 4 protein [Gaiellaceae bacterium]
MQKPLVVLDADTLGRQRTGDESYVANLLRQLPHVADDLRLAAITRRPELVPDGIEAIQLDAGNQIYRMSVSLPRVLRQLQPALAHFQYAVPLGYRGRSVITVHDLSFEAGAELTSARDRFVFRRAVRRSAARADTVLTVSEFTRSEIMRMYGLDAARVVALPNGLDPAFLEPLTDMRSQTDGGRAYALFVGTLHPRKDPVGAVEAIALVEPELDLVMVGPDKGSERAVRSAINRLGLAERVSLRGHVDPSTLAALYRNAACLVFPSLYEGFGLPVLEAMASGTPVVAANTTAIPEVAGDAAILVEAGSSSALCGGIERALADRERLVALGREQAARFSWRETARRAADVYRSVIAGNERGAS